MLWKSVVDAGGGQGGATLAAKHRSLVIGGLTAVKSGRFTFFGSNVPLETVFQSISGRLPKCEKEKRGERKQNTSNPTRTVGSFRIIRISKASALKVTCT